MCKNFCTFVALNANLMPKQNTALLLSRYIWLIDGANVEVVSPKALREQIKEEIAEMHKLYK